MLVLAALAALNLAEGRRYQALARSVELSPKELYQSLARSQVRLQLIDARADLASYEDAHIPGAIPFPGCEPARTAPPARAQIVASAVTVLITDGDPETQRRCRESFLNARSLAGGMSAWSDANLPEDSGEYTPPRTSAGGGCL